MQTNAHSHAHTIGPGMGRQATLHLHGCPDGVAGTREHHEEGISLGIHLVTMPALERGTQEPAAGRYHLGVALTHLLLQTRGAFHVGEEQGDGSGREFTHAAPPSADAQHVPEALSSLVAPMTMILS